MNILEESKKYYWYHCIDLGNGIITEGDYDLIPLLHHYGFPERMIGYKVLDVGRGSGFFSFEFEKRGADVTATDLPSYFDWDFVGGNKVKEERKETFGDTEVFSNREITGAFDFAKKVKNSNVKGILLNVYDLAPVKIENQKFDIVFAGSLLSHLRDPILALERMYSVTRNRCIIAAPIFGGRLDSLPLMSLVGTVDSDRRSWWVPNVPCLVEMMKCANFKEVKVISTFELANRRVKDLKVMHAVVHGIV